MLTGLYLARIEFWNKNLACVITFSLVSTHVGRMTDTDTVTTIMAANLVIPVVAMAITVIMAFVTGDVTYIGVIIVSDKWTSRADSCKYVYKGTRKIRELETKRKLLFQPRSARIENTALLVIFV